MMMLPGRYEENVALQERDLCVIENQRPAAGEDDIEFILLMRVLVILALRREQNHRHRAVFERLNVPHAFWPPLGGRQRQRCLQLSERNYQDSPPAINEAPPITYLLLRRWWL